VECPHKKKKKRPSFLSCLYFLLMPPPPPSPPAELPKEEEPTAATPLWASLWLVYRAAVIWEPYLAPLTMKRWTREKKDSTRATNKRRERRRGFQHVCVLLLPPEPVLSECRIEGTVCITFKSFKWTDRRLWDLLAINLEGRGLEGTSAARGDTRSVQQRDFTFYLQNMKYFWEYFVTVSNEQKQLCFFTAYWLIKHLFTAALRDLALNSSGPKTQRSFLHVLDSLHCIRWF